MANRKQFSQMFFLYCPLVFFKSSLILFNFLTLLFFLVWFCFHHPTLLLPLHPLYLFLSRQTDTFSGLSTIGVSLLSTHSTDTDIVCLRKRRQTKQIVFCTNVEA